MADSAFLNMLDEIDRCRQAGFIRPALTLALCVPDFCRKQVKPESQYNDWCKTYGGPLLVQFADRLWKARNGAVHDLVVRMDRLLDFSDAATGAFPVQVTPIGVPARYQTINAGALVVALLSAGTKFYESSSDGIRSSIDSIDGYFVKDMFELLAGKSNS